MRIFWLSHPGVFFILEHYSGNLGIEFQLYNPNWEIYARHLDWIRIAYGFPKKILDVEDIF
jgi:hypothetical protein